MTHLLLSFSVCALAVPALAQQAEVVIAPSAQALRYTVESTSEIATTRKTLIDGEERQGRGGGRRAAPGGGGGGPTTTIQRVVFDEGPNASNWRSYLSARADVIRAGRDGEAVTREVTGKLAGMKIFISADDAGTSFRKDNEQGDVLGRQLVAGVPPKMALEALAPGKAVEVGEEFDLGDVRAALACFVHPVTPARATPEEGEAQPGRRERGGQGGERGGRGQGGERGGRGQGGERGGRGQGGERGGRGQGGERGGRGQGGERGGRGQGRGRGARRVTDAALSVFTNDKLDCVATAKVVGVADGLVTLELTVVVSGKGSPTDLGLGRGARRGRRGGNRGQGGGQDDGKAELTLQAAGKLVVHQGDRRLQSLMLKGSLESVTDSVRTNGRSGSEREIQTTSSTSGSFALEVDCKRAPAQ